ncbi:MAG: hypothetical protein IJ237_05940, partial [Oscillospiraceae bacterium]|nr:hypothetical protein [Oscillospiraceae bacterium]
KISSVLCRQNKSSCFSSHDVDLQFVTGDSILQSCKLVQLFKRYYTSNHEDLKEGIPELFFIPWFASPFEVAYYFNYVGLLPGYHDYDDYRTLVKESKHVEMETMEWPKYTSEKGTFAKILGMDLIGFDLSFFPNRETNMPELIFTKLFFNEDLRTVLTKIEERYGPLEEGFKGYESEDLQYFISVGVSDWFRLDDVDPCVVLEFSSSRKS